MSEFVEVNAAEITGPALDWVVAQIEGVSCTPHTIKRFYRPSTDWAQGGPLLERFSSLIDSYLFGVAEHDDCKCDELVFSEHYRTFYSEISLPKICRHIVSAVLGDVVQVPAQLVEVKA